MGQALPLTGCHQAGIPASSLHLARRRLRILREEVLRGGLESRVLRRRQAVVLLFPALHGFGNLELGESQPLGSIGPINRLRSGFARRRSETEDD
jgi:hypothetical protein